MADPNLVDFYSNVARFEKARAKGYGFDAAGTLGRSHFQKSARKRHSFILPLVMVVLVGVGLKGAIYQSVGAASYNQRVDALMVGEGFDRLGGWLMQADPATIFVARKITDTLTALK